MRTTGGQSLAASWRPSAYNWLRGLATPTPLSRPILDPFNSGG